MENIKKQISAKLLSIFLLVIVLAFTAVITTGCKPTPAEKAVKSIAILKEPTKTDYFVGDTFSVEGGEITITYEDGSTETKPMSDKGVTVSNVVIDVSSLDNVEEVKTITVTYGGKRARFDIKVSYKLFDVTFKYNYAGLTDTIVKIKNGAAPERPKSDPVRTDGYIFDDWFADSQCTVYYDFNAAVTADTLIYAKWLEDAVYYRVTFSNNFKDCVETAPQKVKEGENAVAPTTEPKRTGYAFSGWYDSAVCVTQFNFAAAITADTTVYAKWTKTVAPGRHWYVFEAEDINLAGKTGVGLSGTAGGTGMIQFSNSLDASNNRFIGYQYESGCYLDFQFNSDVAVSDATIVLRLSAELQDFIIDSETYMITLNAQQVFYTPIEFKNVPKGELSDTGEIFALPFKDYTIKLNAALVEGMNNITLITNNNQALVGTTMTAVAPLVDCLKIETEAVLDWTARLGLPKQNY